MVPNTDFKIVILHHLCTECCSYLDTLQFLSHKLLAPSSVHGTQNRRLRLLLCIISVVNVIVDHNLLMFCIYIYFQNMLKIPFIGWSSVYTQAGYVGVHNGT